MAIYNPLIKFHKSILGAISDNDKIKFRVKGNFNSVSFVYFKDGGDKIYVPMEKKDGYFEIELSFKKGLYFYYFDIGNGKYISNTKEFEGKISNNISTFQLTSYLNDYETPNWLKGGVIYQIFPDRFYSSGKNLDKLGKGKILHENKKDLPIYKPNSKGKILNNDFFGGDILGVISKLDYIKELGVNCIYLNPIFKAFSNHRYDTGNYMQIDELLGSKEDLITLIKTAEEKGIKIVLDGVFNHTGDDSLYFNKLGNYDSVGAIKGEISPYYNWFEWTKFPKYNCWWGVETLPAVNEDDEGYSNFITGNDGVIEHYTKMNIGGWRLDVVDELPSHFVKKIRKTLKNQNEDAILIGEVWEDASNKVSYNRRREYFQGLELDSVMNYPLRTAIIEFVKGESGKQLAGVIKMLIDHYPKCVLDNLMNILSTHDTPRLLSSLSGIKIDGASKEEQSKIRFTGKELEKCIDRLKIAVALQYTLPGVPSVYYGDEIGMQGFSDPLNRCYFDWDNINKEILDWYKLLGDIRIKNSCFKDGEIEIIYSSDNSIVYKRFNSENEVLVAINNGKNEILLEFDGKLVDLLTKQEYHDFIKIEDKTCKVLVAKN